MPIERITTDDMTTAAALGSKGFRLLEAIPTERPGHYAFVVLAAPERLEEALALKGKCEQPTRDIEVHLGLYEAAHRDVRDALKRRKEIDEYGNRQCGRDPRIAPAPAG